MKVSVIIPTLNGEYFIKDLLESLIKQDAKVEEIIIVDSSSDDNTVKIAKEYKKVKVISIMREDFNHGQTRDMALRKSIGDIVIFMTQDVLPVDNHLIGNLIKPLEDKDVAQVTARQIARGDASYMEKLVRSFNYPNKSNIRSIKDVDSLGIKTYFCSDVCAAYNKDIYLKIGGFENNLKTNEDMFYAAKALKDGYSIVYNAEAKVYHSHNYTLKQQYNRNYLMGYEIERHRNLLNNVSENKEGIKLVKYVTRELLKKGKIFSLIYFFIDCIARYFGNRNGRTKAKMKLEYNSIKNKENGQ